MTCIKITESQNGQIYPEDTFSHGAAHIIGHTQADQLLPQLLTQQFDTFPIQCRHI